MLKRMVIMLIAAAAFIAAIGFVKFQQIQAAIAQASSFQPPPEAVTTVVARQDQWQESVSAIGTVEAVHGVTVSADLPGIVEKIAFDSGKAFNRAISWCSWIPVRSKRSSKQRRRDASSLV